MMLATKLTVALANDVFVAASVGLFLSYFQLQL